jgi:hypothetical protein
MKLDMNWCLLHLSCHRNSAQYRFSPMSFHLISQYSMTYSLQGPISFSFTSIVSVPLWCMYHSVLELIAIAHLLSWSQCFAGLVMLYFSLTARYKMLRAYSAFFIKSVIRLLWYVITNYILEAYISNAFDVLFFIYIRNVIWSYCVVDLFSYCVTMIQSHKHSLLLLIFFCLTGWPVLTHYNGSLVFCSMYSDTRLK